MTTQRPLQPPPGMHAQPLLTWFNTPTQHATWLIRDFLPAESLVMISGPRKRGFKTWFALWLSCVLASGRASQCGVRVHKEEEKNNAEEKGGRPGYTFIPSAARGQNVLFLEEEGTAVGLKERVGKILLGQLGESRISLRRLDANGLVLPPDAKPQDSEDWSLQFVTQPDEVAPAFPLWFMHRPRMKLDNPIRVAMLMEACAAVKPSLIVLDALTYMHNAEENDMRGMQAVNDGLAALRAKTGASIAYICHTNKAHQTRQPGQSSEESKDIDLDVRGSSVLLDAYEAHYGFRRGEKAGTISLTCRYREREEQKFDVRWMIPPKATVAPVQLQMVKAIGSK